LNCYEINYIRYEGVAYQWNHLMHLWLMKVNACMDWVGNDTINVSIEHCTNEVNWDKIITTRLKGIAKQ